MLKRLFTIIIIFICTQIFFGQDNYLYFINDEKEAAYERIKIINNAEKEILVSYYIFSDDATGLISLDLLLMKKEENPDISIKLLLDGYGKKPDKSLLYYIEQQGIEIKVFHPLPKLIVQPSQMSISNFFNAINNSIFRMHDKLVIVDQKELISGGRNIDKSYYGLGEKNFYDRDIYFNSEDLTREVREYFFQLWNSKHVKDITYKKKHKKEKVFKENDDKMKNTRKFILFNENNFNELLKNRNDKHKPLKFKKAKFLSAYNKETNEFDPNFLSTALFNYALNIKDIMLIETPYLVPTKRFYKLIKHLRQKGVTIQFITNSFCSTDATPVAAIYDNEKDNLTGMGVELYEYLGPNYFHVKSAIFDDNISLIGSFNMDPRSAYINTELVFIIEDEEVTKELKRIMDEDMYNCVYVRESEDQAKGGFYDCSKSQSHMFAYVVFRFLSRLGWLYKLF